MKRSERTRGTLATAKAASIVRETDSGAALQLNQKAAIEEAVGKLQADYIIQQLGPLSQRPEDVQVKYVHPDMATLHLEDKGKDKVAFELIVGIALQIHRRNLFAEGGMVWQPRVVPALCRGQLNGVAEVSSVEPYPGALESFKPWKGRDANDAWESSDIAHDV